MYNVHHVSDMLVIMHHVIRSHHHLTIFLHLHTFPQPNALYCPVAKKWFAVGSSQANNHLHKTDHKPLWDPYKTLSDEQRLTPGSHATVEIDDNGNHRLVLTVKEDGDDSVSSVTMPSGIGGSSTAPTQANTF